MNNKGFTTVELILTMALVITIMFSITSVTYVYRDRSKYEELITDITNYKNTVTKIIYDDILDSSNKTIKLEKVNDKEFVIRKTLTGTDITLEVIDRNVTKNEKQINEVGINYNGIDYIIPGSENSYVTFEETKMYPVDYEGETDTGLYSLDIIFSHQNLEEPFKIHFVIKNS